jgi:hypothetical protein
MANIGNLELVEAEQRRLVCDLGRGARDRVGRGLAAALDRLMRFCHEFLEVHAALRRVVDGLEEEIVQHGLAAPNPAIEIEPLWSRAAPPRKGKQTPKPRLAVLRQTIGEQLQLFGQQLLRGVWRKLARLNHLPVALERSLLHASP